MTQKSVNSAKGLWWLQLPHRGGKLLLESFEGKTSGEVTGLDLPPKWFTGITLLWVLLVSRQFFLFSIGLLVFLFGTFCSPIWGIKNPSAYAAAPAGSSQAGLRDQVQRCIQDLDAESFFLRQEARRHLEQMLSQPDTAPLAVEEIRRLLAGPAISAELRHALETLQRQFPQAFSRSNTGGYSFGEYSFRAGELIRSGAAPFQPSSGGIVSPVQPIDPPTQKQIETLVEQLKSDWYAQRRWAAERLRAYVDRPEWAGLILTVFRGRLAQGEISPDLRRWLDPLWERAWGAWLGSESPSTELPPAKPEEIQRYLDILARPIPNGSPEAWQLVRQAQRQLRMLLARDDQVALIREAMERRLNSGALPSEAEARLRELADLCRPAMVAEYWQQGQHRGIQHLLVGVPSQVPGAPRPSHFDYIDDTTAHCVSGSNLAAGDYPVGVAIPHPNQTDAFFHLVNLPTPRRRMAYEYLVQRDMRQRLAEITQRTCQYYLQRREPLSVREILLLRQLEPKEVSRFASQFLCRMPDEPVEEGQWQTAPPVAGEGENLRLGGQEEGGIGCSSRHGLLCIILAERGTQEAAPGLLEALAKQRILPPTVQSPYAWGWIAALAIAARDPWPEVDDWLAEVVPRPDPLRLPDAGGKFASHSVENTPLELAPPPPIQPTGRNILGAKADGETPWSSSEARPAQLGATAAALLLQRHHQTPQAHGLQPAEEPILAKYKLHGYRFPDAKTPEQILRWWKNQQVLRNSAG